MHWKMELTLVTKLRRVIVEVEAGGEQDAKDAAWGLLREGTLGDPEDWEEVACDWDYGHIDIDAVGARD
jgi:hypothetical protein